MVCNQSIGWVVIVTSGMFTGYTQGILSILNSIFVGEDDVTCCHGINSITIGTSFGAILRFTLCSDDTTSSSKAMELPRLNLDGGDECVVYCLDKTHDSQLVCGDGLGNITIWSHPEESTTVQTQMNYGNG